MSNPWSDLLANTQTGFPSPEETGLYPITHIQTIRVSGPDSAKFMQGQFSCNLTEVNGDQFKRGSCCNAKGRMITSFSVAKTDDDYLLTMDAGLVESSLAHLKKYMVFFKTQMTPSDWVLAGLKGAKADSLLSKLFGSAPMEDYQQVNSEMGLAIKLPFDAGYELWLKPETATDTLNSLMKECPLAPEQAWINNLIQHGLGYLTPETQASLIPQMMNLGVTGGISFNKGCYTGQEIVARMQYLGKLKRHGYVFKAASTDIASGAGVFTADKESSIGEVLNVAAIENSDHSLLFAVVEDKYLEQTLSIGSNNGPSLELLSLPYDPIDSSS